ncbi:MAG: DNA-processing protein DprA [Muribaculaceae bacterium]|nr:DNA-processing protein DprA [Muribaculaceae bacterium]
MRLSLARQLLEKISPEQFFMLDKPDLLQLFGSESRLFDKSLRLSALRDAEAELEWLRKNNVTPLCFTSPGYPRRLLECDDSPVVLFVCGKPDLNVEHVISIVGTRRSTPYGVGFVDRLVDDLASKISGMLIVSGLAYGIDVTAHNAALRNNIPTVGVLAHGLSQIYPSQHRNVAKQMIQSNGGLLTDYFHDAPIHQGNFLARNRIVAAMSDATIVAESAKKGGAMFTARLASDYGRDVFALPGRTSDTYSEGCNRLIANNVASLFTSADDLLAAMMWKADKEEGGQQELFERKNLSENEQKVIDLINILGEVDTGAVAKALTLTIPQAMILISDMEFDGHIVAYPGGTYRLP